MTRFARRHQFSPRAKVTAGAAGLALVIGLTVVISGSGDPGTAQADAADKSLFVDITTVKPNVKKAKQQANASTGTFTVDCGLNENGHFNPDNFIAAPGVQNGAQHLHDYVGNLTTDANSNDKSLLAGGTTCANGDQSAYFWPVVRIDKGQAEAAAAASADAAATTTDPAAADATTTDAAAAGNAAVDPAAVDQATADVAAADAALSAARKKGDKTAIKAAQADKAQADKALADAKTAAGAKAAADPATTTANPPTTTDQAAAAAGNGQKKNQGKAKKGGKAQGAGTGKDQVLDGNDGEVQEPKVADITFRGSPVGDVVAMPQFLKILYGDAKRSVNGDKNTKASWTCTGFEDKVLLTKYPICPNGSKVKRIHDFPSCWDGKNTDSANHRDHIAFPDANGKCAKGLKAVPQLRISLTYDIPADVQKAGQFKVDSFPAEKHDPLTDHDDFANVMSKQLMNQVVDCVNSGKTCK
ncbi:DUF1996 domain-containing protein [Umezawaea sp. NPDC059074]|uniref:DUF1996 domain-containing protein n=1 Tax=Umezawaea sp. NPDC059074 TaxID=3346716 RepID=UPI00369EA2FF